MTITFDLDTEAVPWVEPDLVFDVGTGPIGGDEWTAFVTERDGTVVADLGRVKLGEIDRPLGEKPAWSVEVPKSSPVLDELVPWEREVQVFRGSDLRFCGPVIAAAGGTSKGAVLVRCAGVAAYLEKRLYQVVPWQKNWLSNPRFDDGLNRWSSGGTVTLDAEHETGSQSALLTDVAYIEQSCYLTFPYDVDAVIDFRVKLSESTPDGGGLYVEVPGVDVGQGWGSFPISSVTPRGVWTTLRVVVSVRGGGVGRVVRCRLTTLAPDGALVDRASLTVRSPEIARPELDPAKLLTLSELITATNRDLNLGVDSDLGAAIPFNGANDRYVDEIVALMTQAGTHDVDIVCTRRTRTVRSWSPRGTVHDPEDLTLRNTPGTGTSLARGNVASFDWSEDGDKARSSMVTLGDDGYRGSYQDPDLYGGLLLEDVQTAAPGTAVETLDLLSQRAVEDSVSLLKPLTAVTCDPDLFSLVDLGDQVPVDLTDGPRTFTGMYRITNIGEQPRNDNMVLTLEPVPE